jgi:ATP-dependent RNA helicase DeaD
MARKQNTAQNSFAALGLRPELVRVLGELGYEEPTPVQRESIPLLLAGRDVLGQAATGTGKTAAFALPILHQLAEQGSADAPIALVLVPTRELAMQVAEAVHRYGRELNVRVLPIYGGQPISHQLRALKRGVDVVVATPGRSLDHIRRGTFNLSELRVVVLDEADEMLDMGFAEDIETILSETSAQRQTVLFSATMPPRVAAISRKFLRDAVNIKVAHEAIAAGAMPAVRQTAYTVQRGHKLAALGRVLDVEAPSAAIVFCRTRTEVDQLTEALNARGYRSEALHGGMSQEQRDRVMKKLRTGTAELLIATDVAARGLDVEQLTHVINYDVPSAPDAYVHRIGRVGRAGRKGVAITFAEPREHRLLKNIERVSKQKIGFAKVPTVADLRARRFDLTRAALREAILANDFDEFAVIVEALTDEFDVMDVAVAAVKLAHESAVGSRLEEHDIPEANIAESAARPNQKHEKRGKSDRKRARSRSGGTTRIYVGAGRQAGVRPQDLVGAIANEANISGAEVGAIEISDRFSLVEVSAAVADDVISALRDTTIKGKRVTVRRERYER